LSVVESKLINFYGPQRMNKNNVKTSIFPYTQYPCIDTYKLSITENTVSYDKLSWKHLICIIFPLLLQ